MSLRIEFEVQEFLHDQNFRRLTFEERGFAFTLLFNLWSSEDYQVLDDTDTVNDIVGIGKRKWSRFRDALVAKNVLRREGDFLVSDWLMEKLTEVKKRIAQRVKAGKNSALSRKKKRLTEVQELPENDEVLESLDEVCGKFAPNSDTKSLINNETGSTTVDFTTTTTKKKDNPTDYPKKRTKHGTRMKADWRPSETAWEWAQAQRPNLNLEETLAYFIDYWMAKPGQSAAKLDWDRTWRNWIRKTSNPIVGRKYETATDRHQQSFEKRQQLGREVLANIDAGNSILFGNA